ncbi:hypothetical protein CE91St57_24420 [Lachnospiraceae bacterium]|nr:hypothetical protein CE91St57_24420 [Lachnospiraceae bacterium]
MGSAANAVVPTEAAMVSAVNATVAILSFVFIFFTCFQIILLFAVSLLCTLTLEILWNSLGIHVELLIMYS